MVLQKSCEELPIVFGLLVVTELKNKAGEGSREQAL